MKVSLKSKLVFVAIVGCNFLSCGLMSQGERPPETMVRFGVFNVGQGLSQIVKVDTSAIVFDMGPAEGIGRWQEQIAALGKTHIKDIVISHDHQDHWGGLKMLDTTVLWNGCIVTSPYIDTAALRTIAPRWNDRLHFRIISAGDTLLLPGNVEIRCIWPPGTASAFAANGNFDNNSSLVFLVKTGETRVLITSDIDSSITRALCLQESIRLKADIMVIPHHGSNGSMDPVFYGYVKPLISIISYGADNTYGHPSPSVRLWLLQMGSSVFETAIDGNCFFESNGYYWKEMKH